MWFVNRSLGGDLREAHGSKDVSISPDEMGSQKGSEKKNEVSKVGRLEGRFHDALASRSTRPYRLIRTQHSRDAGRVGVTAGNGYDVPKKVLRTFSVATDNRKKHNWCTDRNYTHSFVF